MHGRFAIYQDKDGADYRVYFRVPYYNIGEATGTLKGNNFSIDYEDKSLKCVRDDGSGVLKCDFEYDWGDPWGKEKSKLVLEPIR
jgi:hypothetical protein